MKFKLDQTYIHIFIISIVVAFAFFWSQQTKHELQKQVGQETYQGDKRSRVTVEGIPIISEVLPATIPEELKDLAIEKQLKDNRFIRQDKISYNIVSPRLNQPMWIEWKDVDTNTNQVLFFTSPSCGPCMKMKNTVWTNDQVKERISEYLDSPSMIDTSIKQNDDKFTQYKIKYLPTIIMIDDEGDEIRRNVGFMDVDELLNFLK